MAGIIFTIGMIIAGYAADMTGRQNIISNPLPQTLIKDEILAFEF